MNLSCIRLQEEDYYDILEEFKSHFDCNLSGLVWLAHIHPVKSCKLSIPKAFRLPKSSSGIGGYADAFKKVGLVLRETDTKSGHWHYWFLDMKVVQFHELRSALIRRWKESPYCNEQQVEEILDVQKTKLLYVSSTPGHSTNSSSPSTNSSHVECSEPSDPPVTTETRIAPPARDADNPVAIAPSYMRAPSFIYPTYFSPIQGIREPYSGQLAPEIIMSTGFQDPRFRNFHPVGMMTEYSPSSRPCYPSEQYSGQSMPGLYRHRHVSPGDDLSRRQPLYMTQDVHPNQSASLNALQMVLPPRPGLPMQ
jgi:hypothetical protein